MCGAGRREGGREGSGCYMIDRMLLIVRAGCAEQICQRGRSRIDGRPAAGDGCESRSLFITLGKTGTGSLKHAVRLGGVESGMIREDV